MLPFVLIGWNSCDSMIAFAVSLLGAVYAFKILKHFDIESKTAIFFTLLLTVGSNWLMTAQNAWVWFIAQNMAFTLSLMAIYYALKNKIGLSLAFWACAVGCRPFQILYLPALLYLIYNAHKAVNPEDKIIDIIKKALSHPCSYGGHCIIVYDFKLRSFRPYYGNSVTTICPNLHVRNSVNSISDIWLKI